MPLRLPYFITDRIPSRDAVRDFCAAHWWTAAKYGVFLGLGAFGGWWFTRDTSDDARDLEEVISVDYGLDVNHNGTPDLQLKVHGGESETIYLCDTVSAPWDSVLVVNRRDDDTVERHTASRGECTLFSQAANQRLHYAFGTLAERVSPLDPRKKSKLKVRTGVDTANALNSLVLLDADDAVVARFGVKEREDATLGVVREYTLTQLLIDNSEGMVRVKNGAGAQDIIPRLSSDAQAAYRNLLRAVEEAYAAQVGRATARLERALEKYQ